MALCKQVSVWPLFVQSVSLNSDKMMILDVNSGSTRVYVPTKIALLGLPNSIDRQMRVRSTLIQFC